MSNQKQGEVREPSRRVLVDWVIDHVITKNPEGSTTIPKKEIEDLTGLAWNSSELAFVLISANEQLFSTTHFEWSVTTEGLYMLSDSERKEQNYRRQRRSLNSHRRVLASSATIRPDKLTSGERAEIEHQRAVSLHLYEEGKRAMRKRWLTTTPAPVNGRIEMDHPKTQEKQEN